MKFRQLHVFCTEQLLADSKKPAIISSNFFLENFYKVWNHLIPRIPRQIASYMQSKRYSSYEDIGATILRNALFNPIDTKNTKIQQQQQQQQRFTKFKR